MLPLPLPLPTPPWHHSPTGNGSKQSKIGDFMTKNSGWKSNRGRKDQVLLQIQTSKNPVLFAPLLCFWILKFQIYLIWPWSIPVSLCNTLVPYYCLIMVAWEITLLEWTHLLRLVSPQPQIPWNQKHTHKPTYGESHTLTHHQPQSNLFQPMPNQSPFPIVPPLPLFLPVFV